MLHFLSEGDAAPVAETHQRLNDVDQDGVECISMQNYQPEHYRYRGEKCVAVVFVCAPNDDAITTGPCCVLFPEYT
jgi:hypothetical protein